MIGLIPIICQVADARDFAAYLYRIVFKRQFNDLWNWIGLALTLVGLVPVVGDIAKYLGKSPVKKGASELGSNLGGVWKQIGLLNPELADNIPQLKDVLAQNWGEGVQAAKERWNTALSQLLNWANGIPDLFFSQQKRQLIEAIQEVSRQSDTMLSQAFDEIRRKIDEALDAIGQLLDPNRNLATGNGAPTPSGADNLQPPPNEPLRIQSGSGGMGSAPNPAVVSQLAADLGIPPNQIAQAVQVLSQERVRQLHSELGQEVFESLLKRTPIVIEKFSQALELIGTDAVARRSPIEILPPSKVLVPSKNLGSPAYSV